MQQPNRKESLGSPEEIFIRLIDKAIEDGISLRSLRVGNISATFHIAGETKMQAVDLSDYLNEDEENPSDEF